MDEELRDDDIPVAEVPPLEDFVETSVNSNLLSQRERQDNTRWHTRAFNISKSFNASIQSNARVRDEVEYKFYDTTPGGYRAINPMPQFCRHADIKRKNRNTKSRGLGRYYSKAYDDSSQIIYIRAGVPEPNSLTAFLARAYEPSAAKLARTGEGTTFIAAATDLVANVLMLPFVPFVHGWSVLKSLLSEAPNNKFYYSKPAMALYYNAVNTMLIKLAVDMKIVAGSRPTKADPEKVSTRGAVPEKETYNAAFTAESMIDPKGRKALAAMFPDIFSEEYGFDIRAISTRYQRMANADHVRQQKILEAATTYEELEAGLAAHYEKTIPENETKPKTYMGEYLQKYLETTLATGVNKKITTAVDIEQLKDRDEAIKSKIEEAYVSTQDDRSDYGSWWSASMLFLQAEFNEGSQWVAIRVNHTGTVSSSFSNETEESGLAESINSASAKAQSMKLNFANGNVGDDMFSDFVEMIFGQVTSVVASAGAAVGAGAIGAMLGGGRLEIPRYWSDSSAELPGGSYEVNLRTMYGNRISVFKDLYIPTAMIMCLALPKAAGPSSYTSPFTLEIYDPGRWQSALAIMDSLEIERGVGNLGWSAEGFPLGIDISFNIVDLTTIMSMPISGLSFGFNDRSVYSEFMAAMANKNPLEQLTIAGRFNAKRNVVMANFYSTFSASNAASVVANTWAGRMVRAASRTTATLN